MAQPTTITYPESKTLPSEVKIAQANVYKVSTVKIHRIFREFESRSFFFKNWFFFSPFFSADYVRMLESRPTEEANLWIFNSHVWRFQHHNSESVYGIIENFFISTINTNNSVKAWKTTKKKKSWIWRKKSTAFSQCTNARFFLPFRNFVKSFMMNTLSFDFWQGLVRFHQILISRKIWLAGKFLKVSHCVFLKMAFLTCYALKQTERTNFCAISLLLL